MSIDVLPDEPSPTDSVATFDTKAFNFLAALQTFRSQANDLADDMQANADTAAALLLSMALPQYTGTSTTSLAVGTGAKSFITQTGKGWTPGQVVIATSGANSMKGTVIAYSGSTLDVAVTTIVGSGTLSSWAIGLSYTALVLAASGNNNDILSLDALAVVPAILGIPQGLFRKLIVSTTGLSAVVTITADELVLSDGTSNYKTVRAVNVTPSLASSGVNGLDVGTVAANTWYSEWVISNGTTTAGLLSLSATAPTMPGGYTYKARVGWVYTDATGNKYPLSMKQYGRNVQYVVAAGSNVTGMPKMANGTAVGSTTTPTWVAVSWGAFAPSTASRLMLSARISSGGTSNDAVTCAPNNSYGGSGSTTNPPPVIVGQAYGSGLGAQRFDFSVESANIYWAASATSAAELYCLGWEDNI